MSNPLAVELNEIIQRESPQVFEMLSALGRELYFPKGILTQTAEAKQKAKQHNATIGIAKENGQAMYLDSVMRYFVDLKPDELLPYAPSPGRPDLRAKWKEMIVEKNPSLASKQVGLPVVTSGITHGLSVVADMFVDPGDVVMLPDMYWGNYNLIFAVRRGATVDNYPLFSPDGSGFDTEGFRRAVLSRAPDGKMIVVLNFPNNPTGYSVAEAEAEAIRNALEEAAAEHGCRIVVVCDDAYFGLFYEPQVLKESVFVRLADLHESILAIKLDGATKEDYVWGFRTGFLTFGSKIGTADSYLALEKKAGGLIRGTISNCAQISQSILLKAMSSEDYPRQRQEKFDLMSGRAVKVKEVLSQPRFASAWTPYPFNSGYFMCVKLNGLEAEAYRVHLLENYGVGVIASGKSDIRVAFSCIEEDQIESLFDTMLECAEEMKGNKAG